MKMEIINEDLFYEMANFSKIDSGLPYDIWVDSAGSRRNSKHNSPRVKIDVDGSLIPVSISKNPKILINREIPKFKIIKDYLSNNYDLFIKHWNNEITDKQLLVQLNPVK